jgi:hypothetical protein
LVKWASNGNQNEVIYQQDGKMSTRTAATVLDEFEEAYKRFLEERLTLTSEMTSELKSLIDAKTKELQNSLNQYEYKGLNKMENTFKKYTSGVYCIQSDNECLEHGESVIVTTRRGKEVDCIIWKKLFTKNDTTYYSYVREDGFNRSERLKKKAERVKNRVEKLNSKSDEYYEKSNKDRDFLCLAEPIKVGHHSEKRHRKAIENAQKYATLSYQAHDEAKQQEHKIDTLSYKADSDINLDTPECLEQLKHKVATLEKQRQDLKDSKQYETWQLKNLGSNIRRYKQRLETAVKLWDLEIDALAPSESEKKQQRGDD